LTDHRLTFGWVFSKFALSETLPLSTASTTKRFNPQGPDLLSWNAAIYATKLALQKLLLSARMSQIKGPLP
jgi:hypothetical protein